MRQAALCFCISVLASWAQGEEGLYSKQSSWAASMVATRRQVVTAMLKDLKLSPWWVSDAMPARSLAQKVLPDDRADPQTRAEDGSRILRQDQRWEDGRICGLRARPDTVVYLYREIAAGTPEEAEIRLGFTDAAMVWLNDQKVHISSDVGRCLPGRYRIHAKLRQGRNVLRMKIFCETGKPAFCFEIPMAACDRLAVYEQLQRRFWQDFPEADWFCQDNPYRKAAQDGFDVQRDFGWYLDPKRDASAEQQMIRRALAELGGAGADLAARLEQLVRAGRSADDPAWLELYVEACRLRRSQRLAPLAAQAPRIVFTKHYTLGGSHYAYTEGQSDAQAERHFVPGSALCLLAWDGQAYRAETLLADPNGVIRDPDVPFDGRRVVFAWKKSNYEDDYHLYEMDIATRAVRQLTRGLGVADYEPACLPDGDIVFNSTRCVQTVDCWWTEVSNLYRCDGDGRFLRRLTFDQVHDNFPTITEDGRVLYTRWEYNDRGQIYPQPLHQMNPDGTGQTEFYGGSSWFPTTILHARGVPGTHKVLAIATGHHSRQTGKLILIDPAKGRQENEGVQLVAPLRDTPAAKIDAYGQGGELFQYPYPLSETECLVAYHPVGWRWAQGSLGPRFGVYWMALDGRRELLADDARLPCNQPVPLRPRVAARRPGTVDYRRADGTCYVQDAHAGPGLSGVPRGAVTALRVVAVEYRAAGIGSNNNRGPGGSAMVSTPVAIGNGAWDTKVILGDATVREDGSAFFRVPARTPVYFQLLDPNGRMVQTMRSWVTLQGGENASCVGCHEHKNTTPLAGGALTAAMRAGVEDLRPFHGPPRGFSFPREVQPVLDRHCIRCHNAQKDKPFALTDRMIADGRARRYWSQAYLALTHASADDELGNGGWRGQAEHPVVNWVSAQSAPPMLPPYHAGANRSKLLAMLDKGHNNVRLSAEEMDKLEAWIDLGVPFCGDYTEANAWSVADSEKYQRYLAKRRRLAAEEQANIEAWLAAQAAADSAAAR